MVREQRGELGRSEVPLAREDASEVSQAINTAAEPIRFEKRLKFNFLSSALGIQMHVATPRKEMVLNSWRP